LAKRKYFLELRNGKTFEISELDFHNIRGRAGRGQTKGWYKQRERAEDVKGDPCEDWVVQFDEITRVYSDKVQPMDRPVRNLDVNKRELPEVGANDPPKKASADCGHDFNIPEQYDYVTNVVNGINRYYKQCKKCGAKSQLVKKREVEIAMEESGQTIDDVPLIK